MVGFLYTRVLECRIHSLLHTKARKSLTLSFSLNQKRKRNQQIKKGFQTSLLFGTYWKLFHSLHFKHKK